MKTIIRTLTKFETYIRNGGKGSSGDLKKHMAYYNKHIEALRKNFYSKSIGENKQIKKKIENILKSLNIPQKQWKKYVGLEMTVYDFLIELKKEGHYQVDYIIALIDEKTSLATTKFVLGCVITGAFMAGSISLPSMAGILGLTSTSGFAASNLYENHFDRQKTFPTRFRDAFFISMNALTNTVAYSVWIATNMSPLVGATFVAASITNVVKEIYCIIENWIDHKNLSPIHQSNNLSIHQSYARREYSYKQQKNAALINITVSVILVGVMAAWCFLPGGAFVTIGALVANITIAMIKASLHKKNESLIREQLQEELCYLEHVYKSYNKEPHPTHDNVDLSETVGKKEVPKQARSKYEFFNISENITQGGISNKSHVLN